MKEKGINEETELENMRILYKDNEE